MKQLLILSGKGGTGKTTVAGSFISLGKLKAFADCDVDAPNLHLIIKPISKPLQTDYYGLGRAVIDPEMCVGCGNCYDKCKFDAISKDKDVYKINDFGCEGCGVCEIVCPVGAIKMIDEKAGDMYLYKENDFNFSTAELKMGSGTTGKLVAKVKQQLDNSVDNNEIAIIDGSPGIGCPVIASLSGANTVLIVAEPSVSGISDMDRIIRASAKFGVKICVCVNKYDNSIENTDKIMQYCENNKLTFVGKIPYDITAMNAINEQKDLMQINCPSANAIKDIYKKVISVLVN
ncbi:MAG: ATP-binding protein [Clostridia bacterium]